MLPKLIDDIFEENTEDDYSIFLNNVRRTETGHELEVKIRVHDTDEQQGTQYTWKVEALEHRKSRFSLGYVDFLCITLDDPLLWEFTDVQCELYFNGQIENAAKLFHELYLTHKKLFGNYQPFEVVFAEMSSSFNHLLYSNGLVAKGSRKLMQLYAECLEGLGIGYSIVGERRPTYWDGNKHIPERESLKLLTLGDTFIIAEDFIFTLQNEDSR